MGILSKISDWRMKFFLWAGLPFLAVLGFVFGIGDLVPAWQAHNGGGVTGTFTAVREDCGRRSCTIYGDWVAADGSRGRDDVIIYDEPDGTNPGDTVAALDTGARNGVFAAAGGSTYLLVTGFVLAGVAALAGWILVIRAALRRRRAAPVPA